VILVDSNVLIDIYDRDPQWFDWSSRQIDEALGRDSLAVTPVVVAEVGPRFGRLDDFLTSLRRFAIGVEALTEEAAFRGGVAFRTHRAACEGPKSILADFLIGGQAEADGASILTRDPALYRRYFPTVPLICPDKDDHD